MSYDELAVKFTPLGMGGILGFWVYIVDDPTFKYQLYGSTDLSGHPSSPVFDTPPTYYGYGSGWKFVDLTAYEFITFGGDFWFSVIKGFNNAQIGANSNYDGGRSHKYRYSYWQQDFALSYFMECEMMYITSTGILNEEASTPHEYDLKQNYPNPFNSSTVIEYETQSPGPVALEIYNILGQRIYDQEIEIQTPGSHSFRWNGHDHAGGEVPNGIYFYRVTAEGRSESHKMVLLK